jgi:hypothetical protein
MFLEHFDKESFRKQVIDLIQELKIKYAGKKVKCEVKIHMKNEFINARGRIDMLVYDSDGNIELVDFKTSSKDFSSIEYKWYRYYQLKLYRSILSEKGIPFKKIKMVNIPFIYDGTSATGSTIKIGPEEYPEFELRDRAGHIDRLI